MTSFESLGVDDVTPIRYRNTLAGRSTVVLGLTPTELAQYHTHDALKKRHSQRHCAGHQTSASHCHVEGGSLAFTHTTEHTASSRSRGDFFNRLASSTVHFESGALVSCHHRPANSKKHSEPPTTYCREHARNIRTFMQDSSSVAAVMFHDNLIVAHKKNHKSSSSGGGQGEQRTKVDYRGPAAGAVHVRHHNRTLEDRLEVRSGGGEVTPSQAMRLQNIAGTAKSLW